MSDSIQLHVYVSPYKRIVSQSPSWSEPATWPASSVSLLTGEREAVLVDALMTIAEAQHVAAWIRATGKTLTTVYITHGHGDHFFGLTTILEAFPAAKAVALPEVVPFAQTQIGPGYMTFWNNMFPDQITPHPIAPQALDEPVIRLEGHELHPISVGQSDTSPSSVLHVPQLDAVVGGDVVYNGIHCWLAQTDAAKRAGWLASLDTIAALRPKIIVAGHKDPHAPDDNPGPMIDATRAYIRDFDREVQQSRTPEDLYQRMMTLHGERGNPYTLWVAAEGVKAQLGENVAPVRGTK